MKDIYGNVKAPFKAINKKPITPDEKEMEQNSRARSAKLRVAEKQSLPAFPSGRRNNE